MKPLISALAAFACLQAPHAALAQAQPAPASAGPQILMVYVFVTDTERSLRFYKEVFGLERMQRFGGESVLILPDGLQRISLRRVPEPRPNSTFTLRVNDIDAIMQRVVKGGGKIVTPARESTNRSGVRLGWISDPDGASIELIQPAPAG